jgi:DNA mismatch repair protein MutS2
MKIFPDHSLLIEEFEKVKHLAEEECAGLLGQQLLQQTQPLDNFVTVVKLLEQTEEFRKILSNAEPFPTDSYPDVSSEIKLLGIRNSVLSLSQVVQLSKIVNNMRLIFDFFKGREPRFPLLFSLLSETVYEKAILEEIDKIIDDTGVVRSTASPELARIRKNLSRKRTEADQIYISVINKYRKNGWLTDSEESWRNGRRVVSIVAEQKRSAKGIIHDLSATGKTCYIEPEETLGINSLVIQLEEDEREEIKKILRELTEFLRRFHTPISSYLGHIVNYDVIAAKARLAIKLDAALPYIENKPRIDIIDGRHPLLYGYNKSAGKKTIPFSLKLDAENRILVISGPNAGGKTVCMKTVGLAQMMLQSGFLVTADGNSRFGFFKKILVDIGDSQSLEFELSTYSSRLRHMKVFLQQSNPDTLFLIDEFGTGTDPSLGGALAESILEEMNFRKSFGIITTHYMNLKVLADKTQGIINGSMAFDAQKLEPQFRLEVGKPGSSYTFVVAERSGLPVNIVNRARKKVAKSSLILEELLNKMEHEKGEVARLLEINKTQEKRLKELVDKYEKNVAQQEQRQELDAERVRQKELRLSNQLEEKFKRFVKDWREAKNKKLVLDKYNAQLNEKKNKLSEKEQVKLEEQIKYNTEKIKRGSKVHLRNGKVVGTVDSIDGSKVTVLFGNIKTTTDISQLIFVEELSKQTKNQDKQDSLAMNLKTVSEIINLSHGKSNERNKNQPQNSNQPNIAKDPNHKAKQLAKVEVPIVEKKQILPQQNPKPKQPTPTANVKPNVSQQNLKPKQPIPNPNVKQQVPQKNAKPNSQQQNSKLKQYPTNTNIKSDVNKQPSKPNQPTPQKVVENKVEEKIENIQPEKVTKQVPPQQQKITSLQDLPKNLLESKPDNSGLKKVLPERKKPQQIIESKEEIKQEVVNETPAEPKKITPIETPIKAEDKVEVNKDPGELGEQLKMQLLEKFSNAENSKKKKK